MNKTKVVVTNTIPFIVSKLWYGGLIVYPHFSH
ncbi:hypothetical protein C5167_009701 [Papaver somniferum]|uniref:Uncharacterized protein n=1 Tax=Papaver somniferum TaxID=3469 RepID=A0A4Y7K272_PAPSO|nr:hypothetical protein C5167_009701 [Papaver somniferum]